MLTNEFLSCIIKKVIMNLFSGNKIIMMEVDAEVSKILESLQCSVHSICYKKNVMIERKINLPQATYYLVGLFYQTGQKYSCTRVKIGKLLSIVAFLYARKDELLFDEKIYKYSGCGTTIKEINYFLDRDIYICHTCNDRSSSIDFGELNAEASIPEKYQKTDLVPDDVKATIKEVFFHFGAYSALELGNCLNAILSYCEVSADDEISLDAFAKLEQICPSDKVFNSDIIDYLFLPGLDKKQN